MPYILNGMIFKHDVQNRINYSDVGLTDTVVMMSNVKNTSQRVGKDMKYKVSST